MNGHLLGQVDATEPRRLVQELSLAKESFNDWPMSCGDSTEPEVCQLMAGASEKPEDGQGTGVYT